MPWAYPQSLLVFELGSHLCQVVLAGVFVEMETTRLARLHAHLSGDHVLVKIRIDAQKLQTADNGIALAVTTLHAVQDSDLPRASCKALLPLDRPEDGVASAKVVNIRCAVSL
jgi:hypothetical protein